MDAGVNPENSFGSRRSVLAPELGRARVNPRARRACRRPCVENRAFARSTRVRSEWALDTLRLYREMRPECSEGAALMAEALAKNPRTMPDEAEVALRDALCRDPRRRVCLVELARLLSEADRLAEAMEFYLRAIDAGEDDEDVWFEAAKVMMRAGQAQRADKLLRDREDRIEDRALLVETLAECRRMIEPRKRE